MRTSRENAVIGEKTFMAVLNTADPVAARAFYESALGLPLLNDSDFALLFDAGAARLMVRKAQAVIPVEGTAVGWNVPDLPAAIARLTAQGVVFERFPGMDQDDLGIWSPGGPGTGVCWFKDPDGNLLSLSVDGT